MEVLTREELDALLVSLAEDASDKGGATGIESAFRGDPHLGGVAERGPLPMLRSAVEGFAVQQSRRFSNVYQARIEFSLVGWKTATLGEVADLLLPSDLVALFEMEPSASIGFVWMGRPLLFALLCLNFGARPGSTRSPTPDRPYTGIERRALRRLAQEQLRQLDPCWKDLLETRSRVLSVEGPARLREEPREKVVLASIDVRGLGDICRLRIGLPESAFAGLRAPATAVQPGRRAALEGVVTRMPLELRVELGSVEMSLSDLSALREGAVIPIDTAEDGSLLVRVEGQAKFRGIRGTVGRKLAVQLTERL